VQAVSSTPASNGPVVAVIRGSGTLELYRIATNGQSARQLRTLAGPVGGQAVAVTVSSGLAPAICALWEVNATASLWCYETQDSDGHRIETGDGRLLGAVGLSSDGRKLAWSSSSNSTAPDLWYGHLEGGGVSSVTRLPALGLGEDPSDAVLIVGKVTWAGQDTLLVSSAYDDDPNGSLTQVPLKGAAHAGWTHGKVIQPDAHRPIVGGAASATDTSNALAIMSGVGQGYTNDSRAVEINLSTGRIASVISTPAKGRNISSVSGGALGLLYTTVGAGGDLRIYWRKLGSAHGTTLSGLPGDLRTVVAQS
jgi:hypothetical protein